MARVALLRNTTVDLGENVLGGDLRMLGCFGGLLLLLPVHHITNRVNIAIRLELERVFDSDLSPRGKNVRAEGLHKPSSGAVAIRRDLRRRSVLEKKKTSFIAETRKGHTTRSPSIWRPERVFIGVVSRLST